MGPICIFKWQEDSITAVSIPVKFCSAIKSNAHRLLQHTGGKVCHLQLPS